MWDKHNLPNSPELDTMVADKGCLVNERGWWFMAFGVGL